PITLLTSTENKESKHYFHCNLPAVLDARHKNYLVRAETVLQYSDEKKADPPALPNRPLVVLCSLVAGQWHEDTWGAPILTVLHLQANAQHDKPFLRVKQQIHDSLWIRLVNLDLTDAVDLPTDLCVRLCITEGEQHSRL
ncbi:hypothetical protein, partial [Oceanimonas doudoroffii]